MGITFQPYLVSLEDVIDVILKGKIPKNSIGDFPDAKSYQNAWEAIVKRGPYAEPPELYQYFFELMCGFTGKLASIEELTERRKVPYKILDAVFKKGGMPFGIPYSGFNPLYYIMQGEISEQQKYWTPKRIDAIGKKNYDEDFLPAILELLEMAQKDKKDIYCFIT